MNFTPTSKARLVAIVFALMLLCPLSLLSDDSHWFAIPENASFEELLDFQATLREEFLRRNQENNERHRANQVTTEHAAAFTTFRTQYQSTLSEISARIEALSEQTRETKEFVFRRQWSQARGIPYLEQRVSALKELLDIAENDPDLSGVRRSVYQDWFRASLMHASLPQLEELFERLLIDLREDAYRAVFLCDGYFRRLAALQPENLHERMDESLAKILAILETSQDERVKSFLPRIEGSVRFWTLPDQEMELKGVLMDGTEFDLESLRGKIVYVNFWAVWCGPCIAAMPELHTRYLALKDAGFEVVTYSVDEDMDALLAFQERTQYTWRTISLLKSREQGFRNYFEHYGGGAIPKTALIGRDGKVIATDIRGFQLEQELNRLFGDEMERQMLDPNTPVEARLNFFYNRFTGHGIAQEFSSEMYEAAITFIESNPDNQNRNMVWLCQGLIHHLAHWERLDLVFRSHGSERGNALAPEHQPLTVMKRLLPVLQNSQNTWLQEYAQTVEAMIRGRELPGNPMELAGVLVDGSTFDIKDFHGKPVVVCFHRAFPRPPLPPGMERQSVLPFMLGRLQSLDANYGEKVGIVVYLVGKAYQEFPEPDETMQHWKIIYAEDSVAAGLRNYWDYYGLRSSPTWLLIDREGNVVDTPPVHAGFDQVLGDLMGED